MCLGEGNADRWPIKKQTTSLLTFLWRRFSFFEGWMQIKYQRKASFSFKRCYPSHSVEFYNIGAESASWANTCVMKWQQILPWSEETQVAKAVRSESLAEQRPYLWRWCVITAQVVPVRSRYPVFKEWGWQENSSKANQAERWHHRQSISQQLYRPDERDRALTGWSLDLWHWPWVSMSF